MTTVTATKPPLLDYIVSFIYTTRIEGGRRREQADWPVSLARVIVKAHSSTDANNKAEPLRAVVAQKLSSLLPWLVDTDLKLHVSELDNYIETCRSLGEDLAERLEAEQ